MVGLKYVGYKEAKIQKRKMTVGELRHRIANAYLRKPDRTVIVVCLDDAQKLELHSMEDALGFEWSDGCQIELINTPHRYGAIDDLGDVEEEAPTIILMQLAEDEVTVL